MATETGLGRSGSRIDFLMHEVNSGAGGARQDFQDMIALLVRATYGDGFQIFPNPGDWGMDIVAGNLSGCVTAWQTKYFIRGVGQSQVVQIRASFASAKKCAVDYGHIIDKWILCIPGNMDGPSLQWWQRWKGKMQTETGTSIELWDETMLRTLLLSPAATRVCRYYYGSDVDVSTAEVCQCLLDIWSAIEKLGGRPRGQNYIERIARLSGVDRLDVELSKKARNDLAHRGQGSISAVMAVKALSVARHVLVKLSEQITPIPSDA